MINDQWITTGSGRIRSSDNHTVDFENIHQKYVSNVQIPQMAPSKCSGSSVTLSYKENCVR